MKVVSFCSMVAAALVASRMQGVSAGSFKRRLLDSKQVGDNETENPAPIIVEVWTKPVMDWDAETGTEEGPNVKLFQTLKEVKVAMGDAIEFDMNSYINSGDGVCSKLSDAEGNPLDPSARTQVCDASCANGHRYCEPPPMDPKHNQVTPGNLLLGEALRRQCIWQMVNQPGDWKSTRKFFDYVINLRLVECDAKGYRKLCINNVLGLVGMGGNPIHDCASNSGGVDIDQPNTIFESLVEKQKKRSIDSLQALPVVFVNGVLQKDVSTKSLLETLCKEVPTLLKPSDVCDDIVDALGSDEDLKAGEDVKVELVQEIASELGEDPKDFEGKNASELEDQIEKEENADGEGFQEDETKLAEDLGTQDETGLGTSREIPADKEDGTKGISSKSAPAPAPTSEAPSKAPSMAQTKDSGLASSVTNGDALPITTESELSNASEVPLQSEDAQVPEVPQTSSPSLPPPDSNAPLPLVSELSFATKDPFDSEAQVASKYPLATVVPQASEMPLVASNSSLLASSVPLLSEAQHVDSILETSTPQTVWSLNSHTLETTPPASTTEELLRDEAGDIVPGKSFTALPKPSIKDIGIQESGYDISAIKSTMSTLGALDTCGVDASHVINNILALTEGNLKQEIGKIESELPMLMTKNCPHKEGADILHRMEEFHVCAKFDLKALIETFPSTATGVALRCANAYSNMTAEEEEQGFIPEACIRTIEADSFLGRGIFGLYLYPDTACPCFEKLGNNIPECTADVWPIPINGALVKAQTCLVAQYCQTIDGLCEENLDLLNKCLPPMDTDLRAMGCDEIFEECSAIYDNVPPMLTAAPLPDACIRIAEGSKYYGSHILERYSAFRHTCGKNVELWEGHTPVAELKAFVAQGMLGIDYTSVPFVSGSGAGFAAGVLFCIVFVIIRNIFICIGRCCRNCWRRCCCAPRSLRRKKMQRPTTEDYATVKVQDDEMPEYLD